MADDPRFIETPDVDAVISLTQAKDDAGQEFLLLTIHLESGKTVRLPMTVPIAMQVWSLLDKARTDNCWSAPTTPVSSDQIQ